jgi:ribonuclease E
MLDTEPATGEAPEAETTVPTETRPTRRRRATRAAAAAESPPEASPSAEPPAAEAAAAPAKKATRTRRKAAPAAAPDPAALAAPDTAAPPQTATTAAEQPTAGQGAGGRGAKAAAAELGPAEQAAEAAAPAKRTTRRRKTTPAAADPVTAESPTESPTRAPTAAPAGSSTGSPAGSPTGSPAESSAGPAAKSAATSRAPGFAAPASHVPPADVAAPTLALPPVVTFMAPDPVVVPGAPEAPAPARRRSTRKAGPAAQAQPAESVASSEVAEIAAPDTEPADDDDDAGGRRRRRGRRGRGKGRADGEAAEDDAAETDSAAGSEAADAGEAGEPEDDSEGAPSKRRRRRRRRGAGANGDEVAPDDPPNTVVHVRETVRPAGDEVQSVRGSTRLEAKRQRRREGRDTQRRRPPILSEAEFLARREAVERQMVVRQSGERTQIAVLEDGVLVEHYVTKSGSTSYAGNVYLGKVQNVLPSMEAAFIDIGKGRNAVLYAGEVNWDVSGLEGRARSIEQALRSGDSVLAQVTKDPIGHKGARLTSQITLPGRYLVYVPGGSMTGISRKLPDTERQRLKDILKRIVPDDAGVIIRTAAEGASEDELSRDITRLQAQWRVIQEKAAKGGAPALLSEEPDLAIRVVRDVFNEDFTSIVVTGAEATQTLEQYISHVAPDLLPRLRKHTGESDVFHDLRIDEQLMKALDRKVWLPSGGSLVIDRTEAMTVVDVNTGKFTGKGGNLEETVTRNNLEAAEEIVRQLRLRDIGGIIVIDFIDMVLESNRDLVLRRLMECLGRDRTKHQVAEVTSLGLVQMTRKRVGQGLLEAFSEPCEVCKGRGMIVHTEPVDESRRRSGGTPKKAEPRSEPRPEVAAEPLAEPPAEPARTTRTRRSRRSAAATEPAETSGQAAAQGSDPDIEGADGAQPGSEAAASEQPASGRAAPWQPEGEPAGETVSGDGAAAEPAEVATVAAGLPADMLDDAAIASEEADVEPVTGPPVPRKRRRRAASRPAGPPVPAGSG